MNLSPKDLLSILTKLTSLITFFKRKKMEMEDNICIYDKFRYCKYKHDCKRKHFSFECEELEFFV